MGLNNCSNTTNIIYDIAQINSKDKTSAVTDSSSMCVGTNSSGYKFRVLIKFNLDHLPMKTQIISAVLVINVINTASEFNQHKLKGYSIDSQWYINTVNWNNQPSINYENKLLEKSVKKGQKYNFDLTEQVIEWYKNPITNNGMELICSEEFYASQIQICTEYGTSTNLALQVEYFVEQEVHVIVEPTQFFEYTETINVEVGEYFTEIRNISLTKTVVYFVKNNGAVPIEVVFEYSPDGVNFMKEQRIIPISSGKMLALFPIWFGKYIRLSITKPFDGNMSIINTWLQVQQ